MNNLIFQSPSISHAEKIFELVRDNEKLDENSPYYYLLWCKEFASTSAVAVKEGEILSFVTGFRRPTSPNTYFLWQTAAKKRHGVPNLGMDLIQFAVEREIKKGATAIEASVDINNTPIVILMKNLCKKLNGTLKKDVLFTSEDLGASDTQHHEETLLRIELD